MLQNLQIRSKLAAILLVPLAAVIVLSSIGIGSSVNQAVKASRAQHVSEFAVTLTALVHELQKERSLAAGYVGGGKSIGYSELAAQWANVDRQVVVFAREARKLHLSGYNPKLRQELRNVVSELAKLDAQRQGIEQNLNITVASTLALYDRVIQDILDVNAEIAVGSGNERLLRTVSAFVALSRMKDAIDLQRAYMNAVFSAHRFDPRQLQYHQFTRYVEAEDLWNAQFSSLATAAQRNLLSSTVVGPSVESAKAMRDVAIRGETSQRLNVDPGEWYSVMGDKLNLLRQVEVKLSNDMVSTARDIKWSAQRQAMIVGAGLLAVLIVTLGMSLMTARSMVRPLRQLRRVANEVADERLPRVVERLQEAQNLDRVALDHVSPAPVSSRDEIGQVAAAFNSVHQVAVRVATEQAALRKSIGDMFLNLARRSQALIDRQLELIDGLERNEADPDALDNLFKLDHLATRMRRNAEDLIVLSGAEPPRRWSQPVPLVDVVRAALAEVEDYQRVELLPIDDVGVAGHAVSDVVHALAELIENAISFSPPGTKVQVAGQPVSNGYVLEIEDRGLGMSDEELVEANERLANPPMIDFALSRMLGLFVVGRLAQRYGIRVQLRHSWYGGVTALVLLPPSITIRSQVQESGQTGRGIDVRRPELAPPPGRSNGGVSPVGPGVGPSVGPGVGLGGLTGDHLPIFEQARSDWFESPSRAAPPLRRRPGQPVGVQANGGNGGHGKDTPTEPIEPVELVERLELIEPDDLVGRVAPTEPVEPVISVESVEPIEPVELPAQPEPPARRGRAGERGREQTPGTQSGPDAQPAPGFQWQPRFTMPTTPQPPLPQRQRPAPPQPGTFGEDAAAPLPTPSLQPTSVQTTKAGLPRRVPRANLAPEMMAEAQRSAGERAGALPPSSFSRSPEEVRSMLSSYRTGLERGRRIAAGNDLNDRGEGARSGYDGPTPMAPRSDDDAAQ